MLYVLVKQVSQEDFSNLFPKFGTSPPSFAAFAGLVSPFMLFCLTQIWFSCGTTSSLNYRPACVCLWVSLKFATVFKMSNSASLTYLDTCSTAVQSCTAHPVVACTHVTQASACTAAWHCCRLAIHVLYTDTGWAVVSSQKLGLPNCHKLDRLPKHTSTTD